MTGAFGVLFKKSFLSFVLRVARMCRRLELSSSGVHLGVWVTLFPLQPGSSATPDLAGCGEGEAISGDPLLGSPFLTRDFQWTVSSLLF